jgi:hypothetical protein
VFKNPEIGLGMGIVLPSSMRLFIRFPLAVRSAARNLSQRVCDRGKPIFANSSKFL